MLYHWRHFIWVIHSKRTGLGKWKKKKIMLSELYHSYWLYHCFLRPSVYLDIRVFIMWRAFAQNCRIHNINKSIKISEHGVGIWMCNGLFYIISMITIGVIGKHFFLYIETSSETSLPIIGSSLWKHPIKCLPCMWDISMEYEMKQLRSIVNRNVMMIQF